MSGNGFEPSWRWLKPEEHDADAVLRRLLQEASQIVPGLSPDPMQADPVVVMLLRAFSVEYARVYGLLDDSIGRAYRELVTRLLAFPRAPYPATTVLQLKAKDPGTRVPLDFQALAAQPIQLGGRRSARAMFSPTREGRTSAFEVAALVHVAADGRAVRISDAAAGPAEWRAPARPGPAMFLALEAEAPSPGDAAEVFVYGDEAAVRRMLWSPWVVPAAGPGTALPLRGDAGASFVPAETFERAHPVEPPLFTFRSDLARIDSPYDLQFVPAGGAALLSQACAAPAELGDPGATLPPVARPRHWVRVDLPADAALDSMRGLLASTNAFAFANREQRSSGGISVDETSIHSWILPEDVTMENLLSVDSVVDLKSGHLYVAADSPGGRDAVRSWRLTEWASPERLRLRVEMLTLEEPRRRSEVEIKFSLTLGPAANGLAEGSVAQAYSAAQVLPGLLSVSNLVPTTGGRPGRAEDLREEELRDLLRNRGRVVAGIDYVQASRAFDPERIVDVRLGPGVVRAARGLRQSLCVRASLAPGAFVNGLERESFRRRLETHLQDRSPMGERVEVQLEEAAS